MSAPRAPAVVGVALSQPPERYTFSRSLYSAVALLSALVPTLVDTETENCSPNDFPTMNLGSNALVDGENDGSIANLSSFTMPRTPSSNLPLYGPSTRDDATPAPTAPSDPASDWVVTPSDSRLTMSFLLSGGSDVRSTSYLSRVPVTITVTVMVPFVVSARASSRGLFRRGSWNSTLSRFRSYLFPWYSTVPESTSKAPSTMIRAA